MLFPLMTKAETSGDFEYTVQEDGTAEITKYTGSSTKAVIPGKIDRYSVTSIGDSAFSSCGSLTSIEIPEGVTDIGDSAFVFCTSLTSIKIPKNVTSIGAEAFSECIRLTDVYYGGTEEDRKNIVIGGYNDYLKKATWHYGCEPDPALTKHDAVKATCTKNGNKEYWTANGKIYADANGTKELSEIPVIKASGHSWNKGKVTKAATALTAGVKTFTCTRCKAAKKVAIKKLTPTIKLSATKKTIKAKKSFVLKISKLAKGDRIKAVKSGKTKIVKVKKLKGNKYRIIGKKKGKAVITVKLKSGKKAKCKVTVK